MPGRIPLDILNISTFTVAALFVILICEFSVVVPVCAQSDNDNKEYQGQDDSQSLEDPWETPLQELQRVTDKCALRIPEFRDIAKSAEAYWQQCVDSYSQRFPIIDESYDENINATVIQEIDKRLHMAICSNATIYKSCWSGVIIALNKCEPGIGDTSGNLYFALYDDICRDGGRITIENRRQAAAAGKPCERDYATNQCRKNTHYRRAKDICLRFQTNIDCDLSSINPNCSNEIDKRMHIEIFKRVDKVLQCTSRLSGGAANRLSNYYYYPLMTSISIILSSFKL